MRGFNAGVSAAHLERMLAPYIADRQSQADSRGSVRSEESAGENGSSKDEMANGWQAVGSALTR